MIKNIYVRIIIAIFCGLLCTDALFASEMNPTLKNLSLSGFLRMRHWHFANKTKVPGTFRETDSYSRVYYEDLFFRNRLDLKVLPILEIKSVFDISAAFGKDDFSIGNGNTNLITRDVYAVMQLSKNSRIEGGLKPFSFPGGFVLARDATGIEYSHTAFKGKFKSSFGVIKAFDDADDSFGEQSDQADYKDDNIVFVDGILTISQDVSSQMYYIYENDKYIADDDDRKAALHWLAMHSKIVSGNFFLKLALIYNWGNLFIQDQDDADLFNKTGVSAGLFSFQTGYKFNKLQLGLVAEGATGDPNNSRYGGSFQDIKASHGYSYIMVDNTGGIAVRGSGESSWYGLYSCGIRAQFNLLDIVEMKVKYFHFRTTRELKRDNTSSTWLGDEINIRADYRHHESISTYMTAAMFLPNDAYTALDAVNSSTKSPIIEAMLGVTISY